MSCILGDNKGRLARGTDLGVEKDPAVRAPEEAGRGCQCDGCVDATGDVSVRVTS